MTDDLLPPEILTLAAEVVAAAKAAGVKIVTAESCTGGLIMGALTAIAGSSAVAERGYVVYSNHAKQEALGVSGAVLREHGAVSEPAAGAMATGALERSRARIAVSVTGVAGPGASGPKPEGMVCFGLVAGTDPVRTETIQFGALGRGKVREATILHALALLKSACET
ncbi:nicotinamide-nucleotide amidase [Albimonas donghaensis]|uniref:Nicotinamide-nucleotide amidase n=1 Tax=Albimonas donghaensis TaxID=356660 RepID=A0A1H2SS38_9RHOB|nr:CinA family protein [Albimonas donghaensis]SDW34432.1 nicotinamide-nucleotide amidase [Albimonas donghaensis]